VKGVTGSGTRDVMITNVEVLNHSTLTVATVKLSWILSTEQRKDNILLKGQTPPIQFSQPLPPGESRAIAFPVVSFDDCKKVLRDDAPDDYLIQVLVSEITYEDGSTWKLDV
jgi:hypothetical protein